MMEKKISIIVPIYNVEKYLDKCIESILGQKNKNFELILVNDGSNDKSGEKCDFYAQKDRRIKVVHKKNQGASEARNTGIDISTGEFICFIDGDDWIENNMLLDIGNIIEKSDVDLIINGIKIDNIDLQGNITSLDNKYKESFWNDKEEISNNIINLFENALINSSCNKVYKTKIIKDNGIKFKNTNIGEDTRFNLEIFKYCNSIKVNDYCYYHYMRYSNVNTLSRRLEEQSYEKYLEIHREMIGLFKNWDNYSKIIENTISKTMFSQYLAVTYRIFRADFNKYSYEDKRRLLNEGLKNKLVLKSFKDNKATSYKEAIFRFTIKARQYKLAMFLFDKINNRR